MIWQALADSEIAKLAHLWVLSPPAPHIPRHSARVRNQYPQAGEHVFPKRPLQVTGQNRGHYGDNSLLGISTRNHELQDRKVNPVPARPSTTPMSVHSESGARSYELH